MYDTQHEHPECRIANYAFIFKYFSIFVAYHTIVCTCMQATNSMHLHGTMTFLSTFWLVTIFIK